MSNKSTVIRSTFPQVYQTNEGYMVSARRKGLNIRKTFKTVDEALEYRKRIEADIATNGLQTDVPKEKLVLARAYEKLTERLNPFGKTPEEAVTHYIGFLNDEIQRRAMPTIGQLVEQWQKYKFLDSTLSKNYRRETKIHVKYIKSKFGNKRANELRKNEIETVLKLRPGTNNTRKKYLTFIRMFLNWVLGEDKGYITTNPAVGIKFKADMFEREFYQPEAIKTFLKAVSEQYPELVGYYVVLTFCGLRPSEGARVQWHHVNFTTNELHVIHGKTDARHIKLEPVAIEWLQWFKEHSEKTPFIPKNNLFNLERKARGLMENWIADGLRHTFATFYATKTKDYPATAWYMGNSVAMIKKHYARTIPNEPLNEFWNLTPKVVLG